jgi:hypothetical protein
MKRDFLSLQIGDHFLGSINREFIVDSQQYPAISLDRLVDLETLRAHCYRFHFMRKQRATCYDDGVSILFQQKAFDCFRLRYDLSSDEARRPNPGCLHSFPWSLR